VNDRKRLQGLLIDISEGTKSPLSLKGAYDDPVETLLLTETLASADLEITKAERIESAIKHLMQEILSRPVSGETGRQLAAFQQRLGFLFKYKSYTVKCSTPLGYSIFLHNKAEGFSFQRHVTHKTEAFHILSVKPGGYVFVCEYDEWQRIYDERAFAAWLAGEQNEAYDRHKYEPQPGDFIVINKLGTVHSVIGCILEEYANASTDMVDRLHDQNASKEIPAHFTRDYAVRQLEGLTLPAEVRSVDLENGFRKPQPVSLEPFEIRGGLKTVLLNSFLTASLYRIQPAAQTDFFLDNHQATVIYVSAGTGYLLLGDGLEVSSATPPAIQISAGQTLLVSQGLNYAFANEGSTQLTLSEQRIHPQVSLQ
jgi:hypothetical protein